MKDRSINHAVAGVLLLLFAVLAACGKTFRQDPLADQPKEYTDDARPVGKPKPLPTPDQRSLHVDAKDFFVFEEGVAGEETIGGRVIGLIDGEEPAIGRNFIVKIDNLTDYPGATFEGTSGRLKWTPAAGASAGHAVYVAAMNVIIETTKGKRVAREQKIPVHLKRQKSEPIIEAIEDLKKSEMHEGERRDFLVKVRDSESTSYAPPNILIIGTGSKNIAQYVSMKGRPVQDASERFGVHRL